MDPMSISIALVSIVITAIGVRFTYLQWRDARLKDATLKHELGQIVAGGGGQPSGLPVAVGAMGVASVALAEAMLHAHGDMHGLAAAGHHEALAEALPSDSIVSDLGEIAGNLPVDAGEAHHAGAALNSLGDIVNALT